MNDYRFRLCFGALLAFFSFTIFAGVIVIGPNTIIDKDTHFTDVTLDLTHGYFVVTKNAHLNIQNSIITGTLSPQNTLLIDVNNGSLTLHGNHFNISSTTLPPDPNHPALKYAINLATAQVKMTHNHFKIDTPYTAGLLISRLKTSDLLFAQNEVTNFHGGLSLKYAEGASIEKNQFYRVSSSNIFIIESRAITIKENQVFFSGNNNIGDAIDVSDSSLVNIIKNSIYSGSCYALMVIRSEDINIEQNHIVGGITYAISIVPALSAIDAYPDYFAQLLDHPASKTRSKINSRITIANNYLSQNRYGLAATAVLDLTVKNNIFIQRFSDNANRQFWTNNDILLKEVAHLIWEGNLYKEAYTQASDSNQYAMKLLTFPVHSGVSI